MTQASFCPLMNSRVFKNVLEESHESEANFNLAMGHFGKKIFEKADSSSARLLFRFGEKNITIGNSVFKAQTCGKESMNAPVASGVFHRLDH